MKKRFTLSLTRVEKEKREYIPFRFEIIKHKLVLFVEVQEDYIDTILEITDDKNRISVTDRIYISALILFEEIEQEISEYIIIRIIK